MAENVVRKQRGRPFPKGQSGNPAGKPKGTRHAVTLAMETLLDGEAEALTRKAVEMAMGGDTVALRLCMDRLLPVRRDRHVPFALPKLETPADAVKANAALVEAVSAGEITPSEAVELSKLVENFVSAFKAHDLEERLARLEEGQPGGTGLASQSHSRANH